MNGPLAAVLAVVLIVAAGFIYLIEKSRYKE